MADLLLHMDGVNGDTTFVDSSGNNHTVNVLGDTYQTDTQAKFTKSGYFDQSGDALYVDYNSAWQIGSADYTMDMWIYPEDNSQVMLLSTQDASTLGWSLYISNSGIIRLLVNDGGPVFILVSDTAVNINEWTHVAVTKSGTTWRLFINGTITDTNTTYGHFTLDSTSDLYVGYRNISGSEVPYLGYIDEVRIVKNSAEWTSNFSVPTSPYSPEETLQQGFEETPLLCWQLTAQYKTGRTFTLNGPGKYPHNLKLPYNIDKSTIRVIEDGKQII